MSDFIDDTAQTFEDIGDVAQQIDDISSVAQEISNEISNLDASTEASDNTAPVNQTLTTEPDSVTSDLNSNPIGKAQADYELGLKLANSSPAYEAMPVYAVDYYGREERAKLPDYEVLARQDLLSEAGAFGEELGEIRKRNAEITEAKRYVGVFNLYAAEHPEFIKDVKETFKNYGLKFRTTGTEEETRGLINQIIKQTYDNVVQVNGTLPSELMASPEAMANLDPVTYSFFKNALDYDRALKGNAGWTDAFGRGMDYDDALRDAQYDFFNGIINKAQYDERVRRADLFYRNSYDSEVWNTTGTILQGLWSPIRDNPGTAVLALAGSWAIGAVSPFLGSLLFFSSVSGKDSFIRNSTDLVTQALDRDPTLNVDDAYKKTRGYALLATALDIGGDVVMAGAGKLFTSFGTRLLTSKAGAAFRKISEYHFTETARALAKANPTWTAEQVIKGTLGKSKVQQAFVTPLKRIGISVPLSGTMEAVTEGLQDVTLYSGAQSLLTGDVDWGEASSLFWNTFEQTIIPSMIVGGAMHVPGFIHDSYSAIQAHKVYESIVSKFTRDEVATNNTGTNTNPQQTANVYNNLVDPDRQSFVFNPVKVLQRCQEKGVDIDSLGEFWSKDVIQEAIDSGDEIEVSAGDWAVLTNQQGKDLLSDLVQNKKGDKTLGDYLRELTPEKMDELRKNYETAKKEVQARAKELDGIHSELTAQYQQLGTYNGRKVAALATFHTVFIDGLSRATGLSPKEIYEKTKTAFKTKDALRVTTIGKDANIEDTIRQQGSYNPDTREITIDVNSDFGTMVHEMGHAFLDAFAMLAKDPEIAQKHPELQERLNEFAKWYAPMTEGRVVDLTDRTEATKKDRELVQEAFTRAFLVTIIGGKVDPKLNDLLIDFRRVLSSSSNASIFAQGAGGKSYTAKAEAAEANLRDNFSAVEGGVSMPDINQDFTNFINSLFDVDGIVEQVFDNYTDESILSAKDLEELGVKDPQLVQEIQQARKDLAEETRKVIEDVAKETTNVMLNAEDSITQSLEKFLFGKAKLSPETSVRIRQYLQCTKEIKIRIRILEKQYKAEIEKDNLVTEIKLIQSIGINEEYLQMAVEDGTITKAQAKALKKARLTTKSANGLSLDDAEKQLLNTSPDLRNMINRTYQDGVSAGEQRGSITARILLSYDKAKANALAKNLAYSKAYQELQEKTELKYGDVVVHASTIALRKKLGKLEEKALNQLLASRRKASKVNLVNGQGMERDVGSQTVEELLNKKAEQSVLGSIFGKLKPRGFISQANKARQESQQASHAGNIRGALTGLRNEEYQRTRAEIANDVQRLVANKINMLMRWASRPDSKLGKYYDVNLAKTARIMLNLIGVGNFKNENGLMLTLADLPDFSVADNVIGVSLAERYPELAELKQALTTDKRYQTFYKEAMCADLISVLGAIEDVKDKSRAMKSFVTDKHTEEMDNVAGQVTESLNQHKDKSPNRSVNINGQQYDTQSEVKTIRGELAKLLRSASAFTQKIEMWCLDIDGKKEGGTLHHYIYSVVEHAMTELKLMRQELVRAQTEAFAKITKYEGKPIVCHDDEMIDIQSNKPVVIGGGEYGKWGTTFHLIGIILQMGTNKEKFIDGNFAGKNYAEKLIRFERWFNRMVAEGHITKEMLDACQMIWDSNAKVYKKVQAASMVTRGFRAKDIPPKDLKVTINGHEYVYKAGYVPLIRADAYINRVTTKNTLEEFESEVVRQIPGAERSYLQDRTGAKYPLNVDPNLAMQQTAKALIYAYMQPAVMQVNALLSRPDVAQALQRAFPDFKKQVIDPWLMTCATMKTSTGNAGKIMTVIRNIYKTVAASIMAGNINNAVQQLSNISVMKLYADASDIAWANTQILPGSYHKVRAQVAKESPWMRMRLDEKNDSINELINNVIYNPAKFEDLKAKARVTANRIWTWNENHIYIVQKVTQNYLDTMCYLAAKKKALRDGKTEEEAIHYAEIAVRQTQGSFDVVDTSKIEKSNDFIKMLIQFGSYFYSMYRLMESQMRIASRQSQGDFDKSIRMSGVMLWTLIAPAMIAETINQTFKGNLFDDGDDDNSAMWALALAVPKFSLGAVPVVGKLGTSALDVLSGKQFSTGSITNIPALSTEKQIERLIGHIGTNKFDGRDWQMSWNLMCMMLGVSTFTAFGRPIRGLVDSNNGKIRMGENPAEWVRLIITGMPSESEKNY